MKIYFAGSGVEREMTRIDGIEVRTIAEVIHERYETLVFGGSNVGLMGAFADAFRACGGSVVSVRPAWLEAEGVAYEHGEVVACADLAERKHLMSADIDAMLCYPGGVGTWDELFDLLARRAVDPDRECPPVLLYNWEKFYAPLLLQMEVAAEVGLVHPHALATLRPFETVDGLRKLISSDV